MSKVIELDIVETHETFGINFYGKTIGTGNTAVRTCDGVNRDIVSIQQEGDSEEPDLILLFGRDVIEGLRDALTLHLELIDKEGLKTNVQPRE